MNSVCDYLEWFQEQFKEYLASEMRAGGKQILETTRQRINEASAP